MGRPSPKTAQRCKWAALATYRVGPGKALGTAASQVAVGRLSVVTLGLPTQIYDPTVHYHQVRDVWIGVRTPGGR